MSDQVQAEAAELYERITRVDDLQTVHPAMAAPDTCDGSMVHYFGPPDAPVAARFDADGHPPNCPAYTGLRCGHCGAPEGFGHYAGCDNPDRPDPLGLRRNAKPVHAVKASEGKSSEPAAPVETPEARARRLDAEARELGSTYRRAIQDADAAWRQIGGRP